MQQVPSQLQSCRPSDGHLANPPSRVALGVAFHTGEAVSRNHCCSETRFCALALCPEAAIGSLLLWAGARRSGLLSEAGGCIAWRVPLDLSELTMPQVMSPLFSDWPHSLPSSCVSTAPAFGGECCVPSLLHHTLVVPALGLICLPCGLACLPL